jgi:hypothetical protein
MQRFAKVRFMPAAAELASREVAPEEVEALQCRRRDFLVLVQRELGLLDGFARKGEALAFRRFQADVASRRAWTTISLPLLCRPRSRRGRSRGRRSRSRLARRARSPGRDAGDDDLEPLRRSLARDLLASVAAFLDARVRPSSAWARLQAEAERELDDYLAGRQP